MMKTRFLYRPLSLLLFAIALGVAGCSSHSLRSGVWQMSLQAQDYQTREAIDIPNREVLLLIDWSDDHADEEVLEMELVNSEESVRFRRIYGKVVPINGNARDGQADRVVDITATDRYWVFRLFGEIRSPELVSGSRFVARHRQHEQQILTGRWELKWLREE